MFYRKFGKVLTSFSQNTSGGCFCHFGLNVIFSILWIPYFFSHEINQNETHSGCYFLAVTLTETKVYFWWQFDVRILKWNHRKENICGCYYFIKTKIVDQKIKTKMNFISFLSQWELSISRFFSRRKNFSFRVSSKHPLSQSFYNNSEGL